MELTAVRLPADEGACIALNLETGTTTQGETVEAAAANLREATAPYLQEFPLVSRGHPDRLGDDHRLKEEAMRALPPCFAR